jgi:hypothetical protein
MQGTQIRAEFVITCQTEQFESFVNNCFDEAFEYKFKLNSNPIDSIYHSYILPIRVASPFSCNIFGIVVEQTKLKSYFRFKYILKKML